MHPAAHPSASERQPPRGALLVAALLALVLQVPPAIALGEWSHTPLVLVALKTAVAAASPLLLLASWRHPAATVLAAAPLALAQLFLPPLLGPPPVALGIALVIALVRAAPAWALVSAGATWVAGVTLAELIAPAYAPRRIIAGTVALAACLGIGLALRARQQRRRRRAERLENRRRAAEQAERDRIARELHDLLAHSLSQISVQSGMGLHLFDRDPDRARQALRDIRALAGSGLDEARGVLAALRGEEVPLSPAPQLVELPALLDQHRALGLEVALSEELDGDDPASAVQEAAYRIVREALTNVVRHSGADRARVRLRRDGTLLAVDVEDEGIGAAAATPGHGIRSMRERAELVGGQLGIGPGPGGIGTRVSARLPWTGGQP